MTGQFKSGVSLSEFLIEQLSWCLIEANPGIPDIKVLFLFSSPPLWVCLPPDLTLQGILFFFWVFLIQGLYAGHAGLELTL